MYANKKTSVCALCAGDGVVGAPEQADKKPTKDSAACRNIVGSVPGPCSCILCNGKNQILSFGADQSRILTE